jgi:hypothetical protein
MRNRALPAPLLPVATGFALALSGCVTASPDGQVQTTNEARRESVAGAVSSPLRDLNVLRTKIPPVLLAAMADPYARPANTRCPTLEGLVRPLDQALGADLDVFPVDQDDLLTRESVNGAVATVASSAIPFRGWVRQLTGADRHDELVQAAITAGAVRRGYLKGLGESKGCKPPATPSHVRAGTPPPTQGFRPRFPTRIEPANGTAAGRPPAAPPR